MSERFDFQPTPIAGLTVLARKPIADHRGFLERLWCDEELREVSGGKPIRQVNRTLTRARGSVRGLHFQRSPDSEVKFVHCLKGRILDVAVDLRAGSSTFGRWHAVELSEDAHHTLVIPEGFAHGFQSLTEACELLYFHTAPHCARSEGGIRATDPAIGISWPLPISDMSERDSNLPLLTSEFEAL